VRLDLDSRSARVVRMPSEQYPRGDLDELWSIVATRDGRTLYVANPAAVVNEIDAASLTVRRTAKLSAAPDPTGFAALARWLMPIANAKMLLRAGALLSPDERTLYLIGVDGIRPVETRTLGPRPFKAGGTFSDLSFSSDGRFIYALNAQGRWMHVIDAQSGAPLGQVDVGAFLQAIVAVDAH
jgi:hypothetical protein